jgi:hypothetical protein
MEFVWKNYDIFAFSNAVIYPSVNVAGGQFINAAVEAVQIKRIILICAGEFQTVVVSLREEIHGFVDKVVEIESGEVRE